MAEQTAMTVHDGRSATRAENDRIYNEYVRLAGSQPDEILIPHIAKRFGKRPKQVEGIITRRSGAYSIQSLRLSQAHLAMAVVDYQEQVEDAVAFYDNELDKLRDAEQDGEQFVDVEEVECVGGRSETTTTKRVSITQARQRLIEAKLEAAGKPFAAMGKLMPKVQFIQNLGDGLSSQSFEEIQANIKELEQQRQVRTEHDEA